MIEDYSHGMRKKVQLLSAFLLKRHLTVIDETFNGIDLDAIRVCKRGILDLRQGEGSVLLCTHDLNLLEDVADRVVLLADGELIRKASVPDLKRAGLNLRDWVENLVLGSG